MSRLVYALFCEHHTTDAQGRNSFISVFDSKNIELVPAPGVEIAGDQLPGPVASGKFCLALFFVCEPGAPEIKIRVKDPDNQLVGPELKMRLSHNDLGRHRANIHFEPNGIPVTKSGIYSFEIIVNNEKLGEAEMPVAVNIKRLPGGQ